MPGDDPGRSFSDFVAVVKALRTPGSGCPWDLEQTHQTLRPYLIEETYEVLDAIDRGEDRAFCEELGDLLLQIVLHAQMADDRGVFSIREVIASIHDKMIRRHPHVFGETRVSGTAEVLHNWERIKAEEKKDQGVESLAEMLAGVPRGLPALQRAQRLGAKAARAKHEQGSTEAAFSQARENLAALEAMTMDDRARLESELGKLLFASAQLARCLGINAEDCLRLANERLVESCKDESSA